MQLDPVSRDYVEAVLALPAMQEWIKAAKSKTDHFIYSTFLAKPGIWLDDLYVKAKHRSHLVGQMLMLRLRQIGQQKGCGRIDWTVAVSNKRGIKFYETIGAKIINKVKLCRLDGQALSK